MTTFIHNPIFTLAATLSVLIGLYLILSLCKKKYQLGAETSRKIVHIGLGLVTLSFPWIYEKTWPIWLMCFLSVSSLLILRHKKFKHSLGEALHSVERHSYGEICFPISVAVVFQLSHHNPTFYVISLLVLTLADAFAAIVGVRYGKSHYDASEGIKSIEGSFFFFITAFLCVQIPLLLFTHYDNAQVILVAFLIALIITLFEAVAWQGLDNLFIPIGSYIILDNYLTYSVQTLIIFSIVLIFITLFGIYIREKSTLNLSAFLATIMLGFLYATLPPYNFVSALCMWVLYSFLVRKEMKELHNVHNIFTVVYINFGGIFWVFFNNFTHYDIFEVFTAYYAIQMSVIVWIHRKLFYKKLNFISPSIYGLIIFIFTSLVSHRQHIEDKHFIYGIINCLFSAILTLTLFNIWAKKYDGALPTDKTRLMIQGGVAFLGSIVYLIIRGLYA